MSRSKGDQRGSRTNGEVVGDGAQPDPATGKPRFYGRETGSPIGKRWAKLRLTRMRRRLFNKVKNDEQHMASGWQGDKG